MCKSKTTLVRQTALLLALILVSAGSFAQTAVSGTVKDNKGLPMPGVSLAIKDSYDGGTTDSTGHFSFKTTEKGNHILTASSIGYKPFEQPINIGSQSITISVLLKEEMSELKAVTITAGSFAAGDTKRGAVLNSIDIATTAGSNADITAALKTLPGTQLMGEQEGLFVRGGAGYEAKQYIDGTLVANPYYTSVPDISQRGRFSPFLFKGTVFSTGGYSALYGQALSSVLLLESIDLPEKSEVDASISPLFWGLGTQQLAKNKKFSYGINYGYTNVALYFKAIKQAPDYFTMPEIHNFDANFRFKTKTGGMVKYYTTFSHSQLGLRRPDIDSAYLKDAFGLKNYNWYNNLSWREYLGRSWKMNVGLGYSTNKDNILSQVQNAQNQPQSFNYLTTPWMSNKIFGLVNRQDLTQAKLVFEKRVGAISAIRFGTDYWYGYNSANYNDTPRKLIDNYNALYRGNGIFFLPMSWRRNWVCGPKNSSALSTAPILLRGHQAGLQDREGRTGIAGLWSFLPKGGEHAALLYQQSRLYAGNALYHQLPEDERLTGLVFRVEAYDKEYCQRLITTVPVNSYYATYANGGSGYARGFELFWRDKKLIKDFDYWISYSYLDTKRQYLNFPQMLTPNYAATHTASLVMKRFITKIKTGFNLTYSYASGRPYYNFMLNNTSKYYISDQGHTKDNHSLNFSCEYVPSVGKTNARTFVVWFASVSNILGYTPVYNYNYSYSGLVKQPVVPPANRFYFVGCFLSWGVDRTQDAINNNL